MSRSCKPMGPFRPRFRDRMRYVKSVISKSYGAFMSEIVARSLVLLLLILRPVPLPLVRRFLTLSAFLFVCGGSLPAVAAERTFVLAPAELVTAPDLFGAKALSRSAQLGKAVGLRRGAIRFAKSVCPSLLVDPNRKITRVRVLGGPTGAPLVVGRSLATGLTAALTAMNASTWFPPATATARQISWVVEPPVADVIGFATAGFALGNQTGALGMGDAATRIPGFRFTIDLPNDPGTGTVEIALALTTELPATRVGKPGKRTECIMVASFAPVDVEALRDLVNATPLGNVTRNRLLFILQRVQGFLDDGHADRAARNMRTFALEVAQRSDTEIQPAFAEAMINRANAAAEALSF
jgi:hypothetical protein